MLSLFKTLFWSSLNIKRCLTISSTRYLLSLLLTSSFFLFNKILLEVLNVETFVKFGCFKLSLIKELFFSKWAPVAKLLEAFWNSEWTQLGWIIPDTFLGALGLLRTRSLLAWLMSSSGKFPNFIKYLRRIEVLDSLVSALARKVSELLILLASFLISPIITSY